MKSLKLVLASIAIFASVTAFSQTDTTARDTTLPKKDTAAQFNSGNQNMQSTDAAGASQLTTPAASQSLFPAPNSGRYYIAVLGYYKNAENAKAVTITADETNPGKVWVEGLAPEKFYAILKAVPGTYKIPAQKQSDKSIAEGTIMYDDASKVINICLGCGYKDQSPSDALTVTPATGKQKNAKTVISFSGTKTDQVTAGL
jgi:hypothetical protein